MVRDFLRQLFGRTRERTPAPAEYVRQSARDALVARREREARAQVEVTEPDESFWRARLETVLTDWSNDARELGSTPDASRLMDALCSTSTMSIRQIPAAAREALVLCDNPNIAASKLVARLEKDPSLVQAMLRCANSAAMAGLQPLLRVGDAVDRLGLTTTRSIILANCVQGLLMRPGAPYDGMASAIWSHMVRTSQLARATAHCVGADIDDAFAVALLHDVGKLFVFEQVSALRVKLRRSLVLPNAFVHALLQAVHEPFGAIAAFQWNMGTRAANAMGTHHRQSSDMLDNTVAQAVYLAERVDHLIRRGEPIYTETLWTYGKLSGDPVAAGEVLKYLTPRDAVA